MRHPKRFFYIILTAHFFLHEGKYVRRLGFGITDNPKSRVLQYGHQAGGEQEFEVLWYSPTYRATALEDVVKQRTGSEALTINGEYVEWIDPSSNLTVESLTELVEKVIQQEGLDVRKVKEDYLPFDASEFNKRINSRDINNSPDSYLK